MPHNKNAFDALRVLFALFVFISHSYFLTGRDTAEPIFVFSKGQTTLADIGVMGFFTLSGFLITSSFDRATSAYSFLLNRALRILPGFWVCLVVTGFIIAPALYYLNRHTLAGFNYRAHDGALSYVYSNALLHINQWSLGDVVSHGIVKQALNGSLWSLLPEAKCYLLTLIIGLFALINKNKAAFLILLALVYTVYVVNLYDTSKTFGPSVLTLGNTLKLYTAYLCGAALYVFRNDLTIDIKGQVFLLLLAIVLLRNGGFAIAEPLLIALIAVKGFANFTINLKYDISYGLYIYAFPIQQLIITAYYPSLGFWGILFISLALTCLAAFLSYTLVEKPFLKLKKAGEKQAVAV
ncbi:acyltransferase [Mucilaginibacter sp.]|uniref:acyltransferase family protein n=1 Tax=Mucilaginibacter sp. TaxID=1882438 RepID=UPI0032634215